MHGGLKLELIPRVHVTTYVSIPSNRVLLPPTPTPHTSYDNICNIIPTQAHQKTTLAGKTP